MHSVSLICHQLAVSISFLACIAGLLLLWNPKQQNDEYEQTEEILFRMTFSYWLVYCVAFAIQKIVLPDWEVIMMALKITTTLSYFLTFSCIVILPLHKMAVHHVEE